MMRQIIEMVDDVMIDIVEMVLSYHLQEQMDQLQDQPTYLIR